MPHITKQYIITENNKKDLVSWLRAGHVQRAINALENLLPKSLPELTGEPVEYLLDGMRVKLNFNQAGNITSLQNMQHDLQGRWVAFVGAENDKHLKATSPQLLHAITQVARYEADVASQAIADFEAVKAKLAGAEAEVAAVKQGLHRASFQNEAAQKDAWIPVSERLPYSGATVLACYKNTCGNIRRIRAKWVASKSSESHSDSDWGEYDESSDTYYDPEGWYEQVDNAVDYSAMFVSDTVTHWIPLPKPPTAGEST